MDAEPEKILIIKPSALGDIVLALPALAALRRWRPGARISWLVRPEFAPLLEGHPHVNDLIIFERKAIANAWRSPSALGALGTLVRDVRERRFDLVFDFQGLLRTGLLGRVTGCPRRYGPAHAREFAHALYSDKIRQTRDTIHLVDFFLDMVRSAGAADIKVEFMLPAKPAAAESAADVLSADGVKGCYAVLVPGAAGENKRWPQDRFAAVAGRISSQYKLSVVAVGAAREYDYIAALSGHAQVPIRNLAGKTSIPELVELLRNAKLVVTNDTGPGHIAAALNVPIVMIFGPTNPARVHPYGRHDSFAAVDAESRGMLADSYNPRHEIRNITIDDVWQKITRQL